MKTNSTKRILLSLFILLISTAVWAQEADQEAEYPPVKVPANYTFQKNVVYKHVDDWNGTLDLYLPQDTSKPVPLIIDVHGGGWWHGVKESHFDFDVFFKQNLT